MNSVVDYDLTSLNTLALAAKAAAFVQLESAKEAEQLQKLVLHYPRRWVLGGGSNMVMASQVNALVIAMRNKGIRLLAEDEQSYLVEAQAGEQWHEFVRYTLSQGWLGLENLALIPGTVGAAPVQNIGAYGVELDQLLHEVIVWDFDLATQKVLTKSDCDFAYRDSLFKRQAAGRFMILAVRFKLHKAAYWQPVLRYPDLQRLAQQPIAPSALEIFEAVIAIRQAKLPDPSLLANAGSFFKNPIVNAGHYQCLLKTYPDLVAYAQPGGSYKLAAGWLIDKAGWKGKAIGSVGMHVNQALVLVNYGGATAKDVAILVQAVRASVINMFNVELEQEPVAVS